MHILNDAQVLFWRRLLAPFPDSSLSYTERAGKKLTYIDARSLMNRLDSIAGPDGWDVEYRPTARGYTCRVGIRVPSMAEGKLAQVWVYKEDGAGFEEMGSTNRTTGEFEYDVDNDEKSAYTNAFRRAVQNAWGLGRYLYKKGIPDFLDEDAQPPGRAEPATRPAPAQKREPEPEPTPRRFEFADLPRPGNGVYPWIKEVEKHFHQQLWAGAKSEAANRGWNGVAAQWDGDQVRAICSNIVRYVKSLENYRGEFDKTPLAEEEEATTPSASDADKRLKAAKAELGRRVKALVEKQLGQPGKPEDILAVLKSLATCSRNGKGELGLTMESLRSCEDGAWVDNMLREADAQMQRATERKPGSEDDDIPF